MAVHTTTETYAGEAGLIDCALDWPEAEPAGWALVLHPHPLHGGARDNKVVTTIARACVAQGLVALRPNFRGVGQSAGEFDSARGETADMLALVEQFATRHAQAAAGRWVLAGFSFGTAVAAQVYATLADTPRQSGAGVADVGSEMFRPLALPDALVLVGPAVGRFQFRPVCLPADALLIHGECDEVVPLQEARDWVADQPAELTVIPGVSHFFHGKLIVLRELVHAKIAA